MYAALLNVQIHWFHRNYKLSRRSAAGHRAWVHTQWFLCFLGSRTLKHKIDDSNRFLSLILSRNGTVDVFSISSSVILWTETQFVGWVRSWPEILAKKWNFVYSCNWICWAQICSWLLKSMLRSPFIDSQTRKFSIQNYIQNSMQLFRAGFRCDAFKYFACYANCIEAVNILYPIHCLWLLGDVGNSVKTISVHSQIIPQWALQTAVWHPVNW
jgi:hypothetical protein